MNPEENNQFNQSGLGMNPTPMGYSSGNFGESAAPAMPAAQPYTPSSASAGENTLSPADSLASVQNDLQTVTMSPDLGIDALTNPVPSVTEATDAPAEPSFSLDSPLTPAAPVPGSIGSAMSAAPAANEPQVVNTPVANPYTPNNTPDVQPNNAGINAPTPVTEMGALPPVNAGSAPTSPVSEPTSPANGHYNPFAATSEQALANTTPAAAPAAAMQPNSAAGEDLVAALSDTAQPEASAAPVSSPFQATAAATHNSVAGLPKTGKSKLPLLLGLALIVVSIVAVVFIILYINASNKPQGIQVTPAVTGSDATVTEPLRILSCELNEGEEYLSAYGGTLVSTNRVLTAQFVGDGLSTIDLATTMNFTDLASAETENGNIQARRLANLSVAGIETEPFEAVYNVAESEAGATLSYSIVAASDQITAQNSEGVFNFTTVDGSPDTNYDSIRQNYESMGYVCSD